MYVICFYMFFTYTYIHSSKCKQKNELEKNWNILQKLESLEQEVFISFSSAIKFRQSQKSSKLDRRCERYYRRSVSYPDFLGETDLPNHSWSESWLEAQCFFLSSEAIEWYISRLVYVLHQFWSPFLLKPSWNTNCQKILSGNYLGSEPLPAPMVRVW